MPNYNYNGPANSISGSAIAGTLDSYGAISIGNSFPTTAIAPLDELSKVLESNRQRATDAMLRVHQIADTLFGARPPQQEQAGNIPQRAGRLGSLNDQADQITATLIELEAALYRLGSL